MSCILGIDYGERRIGLAVSDPSGIIALVYDTLAARGSARTLEALAEICRRKNVSQIVVGLPLNMDGSEGPSAQAARAFAARLTSGLGLPATLWDERLSSRMAERALLEGNVSRRRRKNVVDQMAAQLILQTWLDAQSAAPLGAPDHAPL